MDRLTSLERHIRSLDPDDVACVLSALPSDLLESVERRTLPEVLATVFPETLERLDLAEMDLIAAAVDVAEHAPSPDSHRLSFFGPVNDARVDEAVLLSRIGATADGEREAALAALERLGRKLLLWPDGKGGHHLASGLVEAIAPEVGVPGVDDALTRSYNLPELRRIALALGLDPTGRRAAIQAGITTVLTDPQRVLDLLEQAPPGTAEFAYRLTGRGAVLGTYCFEGGGLFGEKFRFRPEGSGDPDTDWLAERGLLVPVAPERAVLPREVADAMRDGAVMRFSARPPSPAGVPVQERNVAEQAQVALIAALNTADRLVAELAERPAAVRKSGGLTVRDRKRLTGITGDHLQLWLELMVAAGLLEQRDRQIAVAPRGARWRVREHTERLAPLIEAWSALPDVPSWQPDERDPATPGESFVPAAVPLREGLLAALAALPPGRGGGVLRQSLDDADGDLPPHVGELLEALLWHRPAAAGVEELTPVLAHTLEEAELLGVVVHGAATPVGRALAGGGGRVPQALADLLPAAESTAYFQGDMTATVTGTAGAELQEVLSLVADRESGGHAASWRLTAGSVRRALDTGRTADDLVALLSGVASGGSLPQTVEYLIRDTARGHGRVRTIAAGCVLACADAALARELAGHRGLRALGLRAVADTVLLSPEPEATVLAVLRSHGYAPVAEDSDGAAVVDRAGTVDGDVPDRREELRALARELTGRV
ncbi:helicase-associated domain-containing protein [Nocardiopsis sp. CC223A]|uniref:helicase-associated domain-containing protein n=1 Tax=Nocardiopsis sp. CC223A TaxID=3044051 RepID=UPI00278BD7E5|nr:helicase-associated domain-containing protein [Nocardiopsis sp. CC223A]